jgi:hypothetical protein
MYCTENENGVPVVIVEWKVKPVILWEGGDKNIFVKLFPNSKSNNSSGLIPVYCIVLLVCFCPTQLCAIQAIGWVDFRLFWTKVPKRFVTNLSKVLKIAKKFRNQLFGSITRKGYKIFIFTIWTSLASKDAEFNLL